LSLLPVSALERLRDRSNPHADWSEAGARLVPQAWPAFTPQFVVPAAGSVFTVGSCFARNIEEHVSRLGFRVPTLAFSVPDSERSGGRGNAILNKYTPAAIRQEFEWVRRVHEAGGRVEPDHVAALTFACSDGTQIDLQLGGFRPVSPERLLARRQELYDVFRHLFTADCVVLTLGLVEAWRDETTGLCIQQAPVHSSFRRALSRFTFQRLDFATCRADVQAAIDTVRAVNPAAAFLITTSPVPLDRTFTADDVITATMHGKSVLRAVCGEIVAANERVDYFPSYESVMLTRDWSVFQPDRRHVADAFVGRIVQRLLDTYFREAPIDRRMAHAAYMASVAGEAADAAALRSLWESAPQDVRAFVRHLAALGGVPEELDDAVESYLAAGATPQQVVRVARTAKRDVAEAAAVVGSLLAGVAATAPAGSVSPEFAELWTLWIQALLREERFAEALAASADATRRFPNDAGLVELATVVQRRARRAGAIPEADDAPPPIQALAETLAAGTPEAIADSARAALDQGVDSEAIVRLASRAKRAGRDQVVSPALAALAAAIEAHSATLDAAIAPLWRILAQALMREGKLADAVGVIVAATRRWPSDAELAEVSAQVERKARRADLPNSVLAAFDPPPPPKTPIEVLVDVVGSGDPAAIGAATSAALKAGVGARALVQVAQDAKRAHQDSIVSPLLAAMIAAVGACEASPDPQYLPLWRMLSQALWREGARAAALEAASAAAALWPESEEAASALDAVRRKVRKHGLEEPEAAPPDRVAAPEEDAA
jgi:tetratricopeptide (TPR) repeat protein